MSRPAIFAGMGGAFVASLGNVHIELTIGGMVREPIRGIFRRVRDTDLIDLEGVAAEGIRYLLALEGDGIDAVRQGDTIKILASDDGKNIGDVFEVASHVDDGRAMKRFFLRNY